jgi:Transcriptional regulator, AbiEi antitoxin
VDPRLAAVAAARGGAFSAADAARCGVGPTALTRLRRSGEVVQVRRGAYVLGERWVDARPEERFRLRTRALLRTRPERDAASHHASVLLHGVDTWGVDLAVVDLVSSVSSARRRGSVRIHPRPTRTTDLVDGARAVPLPVALLQTAAWSGTAAALCSIDDALHDARCTVDALGSAVGVLPEHERDAAARVIALADPACESVGETRTRLLLHDLGLRWRSQVTVRLPSGAWARTDFVVEDVVILEFDGLVKYAGAQGRDALVAEKLRERGLWDLGYEIERVIWPDLDDPAGLHRRIRAARARAIARGILGTHESSHVSRQFPGDMGASA